MNALSTSRERYGNRTGATGSASPAVPALSLPPTQASRCEEGSVSEGHGIGRGREVVGGGRAES